MIDALIAGRLYGKPQARTSKAGNAFATAKVRAPMASGDAVFVNVVCFRDSARSALLALEEGDSVAISGELKVSAYTDKTGALRPSLDLTAHAVLTEYHVARKHRAITDPDAPERKPALAEGDNW